MDSAGGAEAPKAPPLNPPLDGVPENFIKSLEKFHTNSERKGMFIKLFQTSLSFGEQSY